MKKYNFLMLFFVLSYNISFAQSGFGSIAQAKSKIEATVPVVVDYLKKISKEQQNDLVLTNGKAAFSKEYNKLSEELNLYKYNLENCILGKPKKVTKCLNYHSLYFRNTLQNYSNYINNITKKNGFLGVKDDEVSLEFNPTEISKTIDSEFAAAAKAVKKMKGNNRSTYFDGLDSDDMKLQSFETLAP